MPINSVRREDAYGTIHLDYERQEQPAPMLTLFLQSPRTGRMYPIFRTGDVDAAITTHQVCIQLGEDVVLAHILQDGMN